MNMTVLGASNQPERYSFKAVAVLVELFEPTDHAAHLHQPDTVNESIH